MHAWITHRTRARRCAQEKLSKPVIGPVPVTQIAQKNTILRLYAGRGSSLIQRNTNLTGMTSCPAYAGALALGDSGGGHPLPACTDPADGPHLRHRLGQPLLADLHAGPEHRC